MSLHQTVVDADASDASRLARLHGLSFTDPWLEASFAALLGRQEVFGLMLIAHGEEIAGFLLARVVAGEAEILTFCVDPALRLSGRGRQLLEEACRRAHSEGALSMFLEVAEDNIAALALYKKAGFVSVGRRKGYYVDAAAGVRGSDALVMRKMLAE